MGQGCLSHRTWAQGPSRQSRGCSAPDNGRTGLAVCRAIQRHISLESLHSYFVSSASQLITCLRSYLGVCPCTCLRSLHTYLASLSDQLGSLKANISPVNNVNFYLNKGPIPPVSLYTVHLWSFWFAAMARLIAADIVVDPRQLACKRKKTPPKNVGLEPAKILFALLTFEPLDIIKSILIPHWMPTRC